MSNLPVPLWQPVAIPIVPDRLSDPEDLVSFALQLRERERNQLISSFENESYEVASTFVWARSMNLLKKQLSSLGSEFIGELLQRADIDDQSDVLSLLS